MKNYYLTAIAAVPVLLASYVYAVDKPPSKPLDWIAGHWCSVTKDERIEEYWLPARGGMLLGVSRTTQGERAINFEFMRIVLKGDAASFIAQPNGGNPVEFKRTAGGENWARFENATHDFPRLVEYRREGERLRAKIAGPGKNGALSEIPFDYQRCDSTS